MKLKDFHDKEMGEEINKNIWRKRKLAVKQQSIQSTLNL